MDVEGEEPSAMATSAFRLCSQCPVGYFTACTFSRTLIPIALDRGRKKSLRQAFRFSNCWKTKPVEGKVDQGGLIGDSRECKGQIWAPCASQCDIGLAE